MYYNGLSDNGRIKLKPLLERYSMLKNLREDLLIFNKENRNKLAKANVNKELLRDGGFSVTDYEFYLSDVQSPFKYNLSAFYNKDEMEIGKAYYDRWAKFCADHNIEN